MRANLLGALAALLLSTGVALADSKESALTTVVPGGNDTVTGLQGAANVNFTALAISNIMSSASNLLTGTVPAGRMPALTGDVTSAAGAVATTIANGAVVLSGAKVTGTLPATNGGTGVATIGVNGLVIGEGISPVHNMTAGVLGQVVTSAGSGNDPVWAAVTGTGTVTTITAGSNITLSSGATCTTACTISSSGGGSTSITSNSGNIVLSPTTITSTGTISFTQPINAQTGAGYTVLAADATKLITLSNASAQTLAIPQAGSAGFASGFSFCYANIGLGTWTISTTTSTINGGGSSFPASTGIGGCLASDGTNWSGVTGIPNPPNNTTTALRGDGVFAAVDLSGAVTGNLPANHGGTGQSSLGANGLMIGQGTSGVQTMTAGVLGQVVTSAGSGNNPVWAAATGSGTGGGTLNYSDNGLTLTANTYFAPIGGGGAATTTEANVSIKAPSATTVANLNVQLSADPGAGQTVVVTLRDAGSDTALTCTITGGSGAICQDVTHSVNVVKNDLVDWKVVTTGTLIGTPTLNIAASNGTSGVGVTTLTAGTGITLSSGATCTTACTISSSGGSGVAAIPQGRLTLTTATPVMTADVTAATTLFYDTYQGNQVPVWNGSSMTGLTITTDEVSMGLSATNHPASGFFDVFAVNNSAALAPCTVAWTNGTTRASAVSLKNGVWTITSAPAHCFGGASGTTDYGSSGNGAIGGANQATLLGCMATTTTNGQTAMQFTPAAASNGTNTWRGLTNIYGAKSAASTASDSSASWVPASANPTFAAMHASNSWRVNYFDCLGQLPVASNLTVTITGGGGNNEFFGACLNSTSCTPAAAPFFGNATGFFSAHAADTFRPVLGFNFIQAVENKGGSPTISGGGATLLRVTTDY